MHDSNVIRAAKIGMHTSVEILVSRRNPRMDETGCAPPGEHAEISFPYCIDLGTMMQINKSTGASRPIRERPSGGYVTSLPGAVAVGAGASTLLWDDAADRAVGIILCLMCGDSLGATPEYLKLSWREMCTRWPGGLRDFQRGARLGLDPNDVRFGDYTDDTNAALALADSMVQCQGLDAQHAAENYGRFWLHEPERGCPDSAQIPMAAVLAGADITGVSRLLFPTGSFANGGAMRIGPVGWAFRTATNEQLRAAVQHATISSHVNPEAIDGAVVVAKAVSILASTASVHDIQPEVLLRQLKEVCRTRAMRSKISKLLVAWESRGSADEIWAEVVWTLGDDNVDKRAGSDAREGWFQIKATTAVACAIWAFCDRLQDPEEVIVGAVMLGGDTDTVGAIAGALCGALHGARWLPSRWLDNLENGEWGRDFAIRTGVGLSMLELHEPLNQLPRSALAELSYTEALQEQREALKCPVVLDMGSARNFRNWARNALQQRESSR